ncbi:MAG: hypothetical protein AAGA48_08215 [Myxococcota bacterium]
MGRPYLGIIRLDLSTGGKRRFLQGRNPWMHPSGKTVFAQSCGSLVSRIAVADASGLFEVVTPCSSEVESPSLTPPDFEFSKLSPDESRVAVEMRYFADVGEVVYTTIVFEGGEERARFDGYYGPEWLPDGGLVLSAAEGLFVVDATLSDVVRIDGDRLAGPTNNPSIHPDGTQLVFEFNQQIWAMNIDGTELRELVFGSRALRYPTWSPKAIPLPTSPCPSRTGTTRQSTLPILQKERVRTWI